jgi:ureidoacrylate peracid hydrolase
MNIQKTGKAVWEIIPEKTALLVVDIQRAFTAKGSRELIPKFNELITICRQRKIPVIFISMTSRADLSDIGLRRDMRPIQIDNELEVLEGKKGADFCAGLDVKPEDYVVSKIRYSAFIPGSSNLEPLLRGLGRDRFIVCGVCTDVCVAATTIDAMMLGFKVFLVSDLTATLSDERQRIALEVLDRHFAKVMTYEQIKSELL